MLIRVHQWLRHKRKWILGSILGVLVLVVAAGFAFPHQILCVDSGEVKGDAIVVLGGGDYERPVRAAELFRAGAAPRVIVTGTGDYEENKKLLLDHGVPLAAITVEPKATSTKENAQFSIPLLRAAGAKRVIVVTTWYHSRRALRCFRHYAPDLEVYSRPSYYAYERSEWSSQGIGAYPRNEYVKMMAYWVLYGVCPV